MKIAALAIVSLAIAASTALALTVEEDLTPEYVRQHSRDFSVQVQKDKHGLLAFKVVLNLPEPRYVVAQLTLKEQGKVLAETATPAFTRKTGNTFHFSLHPQYLTESEFSLSVSAFVDSNNEPVPLPGSKIYRLKPAKFVPPDLLKQLDKK